MSDIYTISHFSTVLGLTPQEVENIFSKDTWFDSTASNPLRFIKYSLEETKTKIISVERSNVPKDDFIPIDLNINPTLINCNTPLTQNQFCSVLFSINGNKDVYFMLKKFVQLIRQNEYDYHLCISTKSMKIFASHVAWLTVNVGSSKVIPDWIMTDPLFSEIQIRYEQIHSRKILPSDIPDLSQGMRIYSSMFYLSYLIVKDKFNSYPIISEKYKQIQKGLCIDLTKFNDACIDLV